VGDYVFANALRPRRGAPGPGPRGPERSESVALDDGSAPPSPVANLTVTFIGPVPRDDGAWELRRQDGNSPLTVRGGRVPDAQGRGLQGDRVPGGDGAEAFFRLSGNADGDRDVDDLDPALLDLAFGSSARERTSLGYFDFNGDGDTLDRDEFFLRLGSGLRP
jgi:hypothetical protein